MRYVPSKVLLSYKEGKLKKKLYALAWKGMNLPLHLQHQRIVEKCIMNNTVIGNLVLRVHTVWCLPMSSCLILLSLNIAYHAVSQQIQT